MELLSIVSSDTLHTLSQVTSELKNSQDHAEIFKWLATGAGAVIVVFATYVLTSWTNTVRSLKDSIVKLTSGVGLLSEEIHVNRAEEIAHRGLFDKKHKEHEREFVFIKSDIEDVKEDLQKVKDNVLELHTEHNINHSLK